MQHTKSTCQILIWAFLILEVAWFFTAVAGFIRRESNKPSKDSEMED